MSRARGNPLRIFRYTEEKLAWRNFSRDSRATRTTSKQKLRKKIYRSCQPFASLWDFLCENNFHARRTRAGRQTKEKRFWTILSSEVTFSDWKALQQGVSHSRERWCSLPVGVSARRNGKSVTRSRIFYFCGFLVKKRVGKCKRNRENAILKRFGDVTKKKFYQAVHNDLKL